MLTKDDKLRIIDLVEQNKGLFFNGGIDKWIEDDKVMGSVYGDTGTYYRTWFKGYYYECLQYWKEAMEFYTKIKRIADDKKLNEYDIH